MTTERLPRALIFLLALVSCRTVAPAAPSAEPAAAQAPAPTPPALRLPGDVVPTQYRLELTVRPDADRLTGKVRIGAEVRHATQVVWLNATDLSVKTARLGGQPARVVPGGEDFVGLVAEAPLKPGPLAIELEYQALIDHQKSRGVYAEKEGADVYAYTFFEPIDARRAFPCFDEPAYKVPWQLVLHVPKADVALANTPVQSEADEADGLKRVEFALSPPLPSYLVAFVVGPFDVVDGGSAAGVPIRFVLPKGRAAELGWAKEVTPRSLAALIDWFGSGYPFKKLDVAVVPRFWGTMEHPGLVAMGQPLTLIREAEATRQRKENYLTILSHELGHYWFGDWVTTQWWDDTWLNEALAEWNDLIITDRVMPAWHVLDERVGEAAAAMKADELLGTQAIRQKVESNEAIAAAFDGEITYAKGASVLRMFEAAAGADKWQAFIRRYLAAHQFANATADDFLAAMKQDLGAPVADGFAGFLERPGVPLVEGKLECGAAPTLVLSQRRSLPFGVKEPEPRAGWAVPVCVRYGDGKSVERSCVQLSPSPDATTPLALKTKGCPSWVLLNDDARGYYRSRLDPKGVKQWLTAGSPAGKQAKLSVAERMMIAADLRASVSRAELSLVDALELGALMAKDPSDKVAMAGLDLAGIRTDPLEDEWYHRAQRYELSELGPLARRLGWKRGPKDDDDRERLRLQALAIATGAGDDKLAAEGTALAEAWLKDHAKAGLDDDLVGLALWVAARHGDAARYERYLEAARHAADRTEKDRLVSALGGFTDPKLAQRSLDLVLGPEFDLRETTSVVQRLLYRRETRALAWAWLQSHLDEMIAKMRSDEAGWLMSSIAGAFCEPKGRQEADQLLTPRAAKVDGAQALVSRGLADAGRCIDEQARDREALQRFLSRFH